MKCINSATPNGNPEAKKQTEQKEPVKTSKKKDKADEE